MTRALFRVEFEIDADAFAAGQDDAVADVRISLRQVAEFVTRGRKAGFVLDADGTRTGSFGVRTARGGA